MHQNQSGINSRHYHSFASEDFVGRVVDLAGACHKSNLEKVILKRHYMGLFHSKDMSDEESSD